MRRMYCLLTTPGLVAGVAVANVFISHAGADIDWAEQIHQWLSADNHDSFLDRHKDDGIPVGVDWQRRIFELAGAVHHPVALGDCNAVQQNG